MKLPFLTALFVFAAGLAHAAAPSLSMGPNGLVYTTDSLGNRIPDYSYAGYKGGGVAIPTFPNKVVISPLAAGADNTSAIQSAINKVSALTPDANGFRGAVFLNPGTYNCSGTLSITTGGVVLRGAGATTIINATGAARTFLNVSGSSGISNAGSATNITDTYVPCGATTFHVSSASNFAVGNTVTITRPTAQAWIDDIHMGTSEYLGTEGWTTSTGTLVFERTITAISGTQITIDIPLCNSIETTAYGLIGTMQRYIDGRMKFSGVENLTLSAAFNDCPPVVTPGNVLNGIAIDLSACEHCWIRNVKMLGQGNGIEMPSNAKWCSILDCDYEFPCTDQNTDAQPFAYSITGKQNLVARCTASNGFHYHLFATQQFSGGPCVFLDCTAVTNDWLDGGPHQKWGAGMLFDRCIFTKTTSAGITCEIRLQNRNDFGTGQGWSMAFSTAYNCQAPNISVQEPAYATKAPFYNWCIGGIGKRDTSTNVEDPDGEYQNFGTLVNPSSLYLEQLKERLGTSALQNIGYPRFAGNYQLRNVSTGKAVTLQSSSSADGTPIVQLPFANSANAKWQFIDVGSGRYEIKNAVTGKALTVTGNSSAAGALIAEATYTGNGSDQWTAQDLPGGITEFINKTSGKVLEIPGGSTADNTQLDQAVYTAAPYQQFQIISTP